MKFRHNDKRHSKPNRLTIESLEQRALMDGHGLDFEIPREAPEPGPYVELKGPAAPEVRIVETSDNTVTLEYVDQSTDERGFRVQRMNPDSSWKGITQVVYAGNGNAANSTGRVRTWVDGPRNNGNRPGPDGLTPGTEYCYRVVAVNDFGANASSVVCGTTTGNTPVDPPENRRDHRQPNAPRGITIADVGARSVSFNIETYNPLPNQELILKATVIGTGRSRTHSLSVSRENGRTTVQTEDVLKPGKEYCFELYAENQNGRTDVVDAGCDTTKLELLPPTDFQVNHIDPDEGLIRVRFFDPNKINANYAISVSGQTRESFEINEEFWNATTGWRSVAITNVPNIQQPGMNCISITASNEAAQHQRLGASECLVFADFHLWPTSTVPVVGSYTVFEGGRFLPNAGIEDLVYFSIPAESNPPNMRANFINATDRNRKCSLNNEIISLDTGETTTRQDVARLINAYPANAPLQLTACVAHGSDIHGIRVKMLYRLKNTSVARVLTPGDANSDGLFDSSDLVAIFQANEYEDGVEDNSSWSEGDFDGDGDFTSSDLVYAFIDGNYVAAIQSIFPSRGFPALETEGPEKANKKNEKSIHEQAIDHYFLHATGLAS